ncbi:MAG: PDZ domain-containing protein [Planctomycetales bacterium]|nr:PDZ domain-containing protein [Planctomycetales bacterium]
MKAFLITLLLFVSGPLLVNAQDASVDLLEQQVWQNSAVAVADSVVQIRTVGGLDRVGKTLLAAGPTTGLIVSSDGYIVSSLFNFAGQPTSILVRLSSGQQLPAKLVARDTNRMLVLLKIEPDSPLHVPQAVPLAKLRVGQWSIALGRTFRAEMVDFSVGIVSALNRMYGRAIQTDASISAANYGGPLVDYQGRVIGVLVPMAPQSADTNSDNEVAGAEFYDSGIGFAIPLEHVLSVLDRWKAGADLLPGKLGVGLVSGEAHLSPPRITAVWPNSPAADAGWKPDDLVTVIDGQRVETQADLRFQVVPRYAGDTLDVTIKRAEQELETKVTLAGELVPYRQPFLGILPARTSSPEEAAGVLVAGVWPESPAQTAGVEAGDLLLKLVMTELSELADALKVVDSLHPQDLIELTVKRGEEELTLTAELAALPDEILSSAALPTRRQNGEEPAAETAEPELESLVLPDFSQTAKFFLPPAAESRSPGLVIWLADGSGEQDQELLSGWQEICLRDQVVLLIAHPADAAGWAAEDLEFLWRLTRSAQSQWNVDRRRIAIGGQQKAGQLAYALAFKRREDFSGVFSIDAPLPRTLQIPENRPGGQLAALVVESRNSTFAPLLRQDLQNLRQAGYSASWLQRPVASDPAEPLDATTHSAIARWLDGLDRF